MIYAFKTERKDEVINSVCDISYRLTGNNLIKNPFKDGDARYFIDKDNFIVFLKMPTIYIISLPGWLVSIGFKWGLKKKGYQGKIKRMSKKEIMMYLYGVLWDSRK